MDNARKVAENIHDDFMNREFPEKEQKLQRTTNLIRYYVEDIIKVINDISKNSLNEEDANKRLVELSAKCGVGIHIKLKI